MIRRTYKIVILITFFLLMCSLQNHAFSKEIYKRIDNEGKVLYTDDLNKIKSNNTSDYEIIKSKKNYNSKNNDLEIYYYIENLFNDNPDKKGKILEQLELKKQNLQNIILFKENFLITLLNEINSYNVKISQCYFNRIYYYLGITFFCNELEYIQEEQVYDYNQLKFEVENLKLKLLSLNNKINNFKTVYEPIKCYVTKIIDGDTFQCSFSGLTKTVKMIGVDTPETQHLNKPDGYFGKDAERFTNSIIFHKIVTLVFDNQKMDKSDRILAYVYLNDSTMVNAMIIRQGYGFALLDYPFKYMAEFKEYEDLARENKFGLWKENY